MSFSLAAVARVTSAGLCRRCRFLGARSHPPRVPAAGTPGRDAEISFLPPDAAHCSEKRREAVNAVGTRRFGAGVRPHHGPSRLPRVLAGLPVPLVQRDRPGGLAGRRWQMGDETLNFLTEAAPRPGVSRAGAAGGHRSGRGAARREGRVMGAGSGKGEPPLAFGERGWVDVNDQEPALRKCQKWLPAGPAEPCRGRGRRRRGSGPAPVSARSHLWRSLRPRDQSVPSRPP